MRYMQMIFVFILMPGLLFSATLYVPSVYPSIQFAIDSALPGDVVVVEPGTYFENIDFLGLAITVESEQGPNVTVIDGGYPYHPDFGSVVTFQHGEGPDSVLKGFTITNGSGTFTELPVGWVFAGGGIYCYESSPLITENIINQNTTNSEFSGRGGGIYCGFESGPLIMINLISENVTVYTEDDAKGGGIFCFENDEETPRIIENIIMNNNANYGGGIAESISSSEIINNQIINNQVNISGGGIRTIASSSLVLNNVIENNSANYGAGLQMQSGSPIIQDNKISYNSANTRAGGIRLLECDMESRVVGNMITENQGTKTGGIQLSECDTLVLNNWIENNDGTSGGGIQVGENSTPIIVNNHIIRNTAMMGGGIRVYDSTLYIINNTIYGNTADIGGGIASLEGAMVTIINSILWDNTAINKGPQISVGITSNPSTVLIDYSDVEGGYSLAFVEPFCNLIWGSNMIEENPCFLDPTNNEFHLTCVSLCIDSGCNTVSQLPETDFEGDPRIFTGNGKGILVGTSPQTATVDMGADEYCMMKKQQFNQK